MSFLSLPVIIVIIIIINSKNPGVFPLMSPNHYFLGAFNSIIAKWNSRRTMTSMSISWCYLYLRLLNVLLGRILWCLMVFYPYPLPTCSHASNRPEENFPFLHMKHKTFVYVYIRFWGTIIYLRYNLHWRAAARLE